MNNIILPDTVVWEANRKRIKLAFDYLDNIVTIDGLDFQLKYLDEYNNSKGGNSNVFLLVNPIEPDNINDQIVIKICNQPLERSSKLYKKRFKRELVALKRANKYRKKRIIKYFHEGIMGINHLQFPFYTMEKADWDLAKYLQENELHPNQKILLFLEIIKGFKELHQIEIYHRDIKHDNIFIIGKECRIGDLGLMRFRHDDIKFEEIEKGDRIGAFGWESPETMNKYLTEKFDNGKFDCEIDGQSDIFQLGKLFWYILQGNLPIGQITIDDFILGDPQIYQLIFSMLQYSKGSERRIKTIDELEEKMEKVASNRNLI